MLLFLLLMAALPFPFAPQSEEAVQEPPPVREQLVEVTPEGDAITAPDRPSASSPRSKQEANRRYRLGARPDSTFKGPGARVARVIRGSAAEKAGFAPGDVILSLDGREVADSRAFGTMVESLAPGQHVEAAVRRRERIWIVLVTVPRD